MKTKIKQNISKAILIGAVLATGESVQAYAANQIASGTEWRKVTEEEIEILERMKYVATDYLERHAEKQEAFKELLQLAQKLKSSGFQLRYLSETGSLAAAEERIKFIIASAAYPFILHHLNAAGINLGR